MAKFANAIPRLNTEAINSGALSAARLQGLAEGSQQSGVDRALRTGVAALRERQEALVRETNRQKAISQVKINEQKVLQSSLLFDEQKEQAILQTQNMRFQNDKLKRTSERREQQNQILNTISGTVSNPQEKIGMVRTAAATFLMTPENKEEQVLKAAAKQALDREMNTKLNVSGLGAFGLNDLTQITFGEGLMLIGQERDPGLKKHMIQQFQNNGFTEAQAMANVNIGRDMIQTSLLTDLPQRSGEGSLGLISETEDEFKNISSIARAQSSLIKMKEGLLSTPLPSVDEAGKTRAEIRAEKDLIADNRQNQIDSIDGQINDLAGQISNVSGTTGVQADDDTIGEDDFLGNLLRPSSGGSNTVDSPSPSRNNNLRRQPATNLPGTILIAQIRAAKALLKRLRPGPQKVEATRKLNVLQDKALEVPSQIAKTEELLLDALGQADSVSSQNVVERLEVQLTDLKQDRQLLENEIPGGFDTGTTL